MTKAKSGQPKSRVGQGMKPRGNAEGIKVESVTEEKPVSTDQVQTEGTEQPSQVAPEGEQTPPSQEPKTGENGENEPTAGLAGSNALAEMLRQSGDGAENTAKVKPADDPAQVLAAIGKDAQERHAMAMEPHPSQAPIRPPEDLPLGGYSFKFDNELDKIQVFRSDSGAPMDFVGVGDLPNGDHAVVITIPEELVTGVKDFAEADGKKSVQQWCTEFFVMNLEAYCTPTKGR